MKTVSQGITILKRYGHFKNACWILHNNGEAAIVEMPPNKKTERPPYEKALSFFKKNRLFPKYGLISHPHYDHCFSLPFFRIKFPQARFIAHKSFFEDSYIQFILRNVANIEGRGWVIQGLRIFDEVFDGDIWQGDLGGEPLYIIYAPKHSFGDLMIVFKGAMITGDWYLGDLNDCNDLVDRNTKIRSIDNLMRIVAKLNYNIHMLFSAHGDHLFYDADFFSVMEESKISHNGRGSNIKATLVPGGRSI